MASTHFHVSPRVLLKPNILLVIVLGLLFVIDVATTNAKLSTQDTRPTFVLAFLPVNWSGSLDEFDRAADERASLFLDASGIEGYARVEVKLIHEILWDDLTNDQLHTAVARFGLEREAADVYIGLTEGDVLPDTSTAGWSTFGGNGVIVEVDAFPSAVAHELGHIFYLCDEYNDSIWRQQNTSLILRGGCPNPYPEICEVCTAEEDVCCLGWPTDDGENCIMGPVNPDSSHYGRECLTPLQQTFADIFGRPPKPVSSPEATPTPMPLPATPTPLPPSTPSPSPFYFSTLVENEDKLQLMLVDQNGVGEIAAIPVEGSIYAAAWQPSGERAILSVGQDTNLDLYLWQTSTEQLTRLTQTSFNEAQPAWQPAEEEIVFISDQTGNNDVYLLDLSTQLQTQLTSSPGNEYGPVFSPDSRYLSYSYDLDGHTTLALLDLESKTVTYLELGVEALHPAWSFDGQRLAFAAAYEDSWDIAVWHLNTGRLERLTYGGGQHLTPTWLPTAQLLFQTNQEQHWTIYSMNADGSNWQAIIQSNNNARDPTFIK